MRGRPRKQDAADKKTMALREANRRAYAKRTGKPVPPKKDVFMDAIKAKLKNEKWHETFERAAVGKS